MKYPNLRLALPEESFIEDYIAALHELRTTSNVPFMAMVPLLSEQDDTRIRQDFNAYILKPILDRSRGINLPEGYVPDTDFWLTDGKTWVGQLSLRHRLPERARWAGHVGYLIRPSLRGKGYMKEALPMILKEAANVGLSEVMISHRFDNVPSKRVILGGIERFGGRMEEPMPNADGVQMFPGWIKVPDAR